jgi:23S rRNA pseudouridine2605 synthase
VPSDSSATTIRLNKFLSQCGIASRRNADALITAGKVIVNGKKVTDLGTKVNPSKDKVTVKGRPVLVANSNKYYMFNKPVQVLTSLGDPEGRPNISDYTQHLKFRVFPVGRLDWDTEGLLILTNDGEFAQKISHPKSEIPKTYMAKLKGNSTPENVRKLIRGVSIIGGKAKALSVRPVGRRGEGKYDWVEITITEGRNRQVRKMFEKIGCDVIKLQRVAIGQLQLGKLKRGALREMTILEIEKLFLP